MFCTNCGEKLNGDAKFCVKCGQKVASAATPAYQTPSASMPHPVPPQQKHSSKNVLVFVGVIVAIVIVVAILSKGFGLKGAKDSSPQDPANISINQMMSDVLNVGASSNANNLFFSRVDSFEEFAVAKTVADDDKDKVAYHVDYVVSSGHLVERGVMLANDYTEGRIIIQYYKKTNGTWVFDGFTNTQSATHRPTAIEDSTSEPQTNIPNQTPKPELQFADYPGVLTIDSHWQTEGINGYIFEEHVKLWEPKRAEMEFSHPSAKSHVIPEYGDDVWVIPFEKSIKNISEGFGAAPYRHVLGTLSFDTDKDEYNTPIYVYTSAPFGGDAEYYRKNGWSYFETAVYSSGDLRISKPNDGWYSADDANLDEGKSIVWRGFYIFHEPPRTPNNPNETTDSYFWSSRFTYQTVYNGKALFAGITSVNMFSSNVWQPRTERAVAFLRKNDAGELVLTTNTHWQPTLNDSDSAPSSSAIVSESDVFYVADYANMLSSETEALIYTVNVELERQCKGSQFVVVTVDSFGGMTSEEYATMLFKDWDVGNSVENNGTLLLLSPIEREYYIRSGVLDSTSLDLIMHKEFVPYGNIDEYDTAIENLMNSIMAEYDRIYGSAVSSLSK